MNYVAICVLGLLICTTGMIVALLHDLYVPAALCIVGILASLFAGSALHLQSTRSE
jgi:hypothetical protein